MLKREIGKVSETLKLLCPSLSANFFFAFYAFIKTVIFLAGIYFIFLKKRPGPNLKVLRYQILTSAERLEK